MAESVDSTDAAVVLGGTAMVAVMRTLADENSMLTNAGSTPASSATLFLMLSFLPGSA